jgi:hypothetical protein
MGGAGGHVVSESDPTELEISNALNQLFGHYVDHEEMDAEHVDEDILTNQAIDYLGENVYAPLWTPPSKSDAPVSESDAPVSESDAPVSESDAPVSESE